MDFVDNSAEDSSETRRQPPVSPYLLRPLRSLDQAAADLGEKAPAPPAGGQDTSPRARRRRG